MLKFIDMFLYLIYNTNNRNKYERTERKGHNMGISLRILIEKTSAEDYFYVNVMKQGKSIYLGYAHEPPEELRELIVENLYVDFASYALGVDVR